MSFEFLLGLIEPSLWYDDTKTAQMNKELKTQVFFFLCFYSSVNRQDILLQNLPWRGQVSLVR